MLVLFDNDCADELASVETDLDILTQYEVSVSGSLTREVTLCVTVNISTLEEDEAAEIIEGFNDNLFELAGQIHLLTSGPN